MTCPLDLSFSKAGAEPYLLIFPSTPNPAPNPGPDIQLVLRRCLWPEWIHVEAIMRQEELRDWLPVDVTFCPRLLFITVLLEECVFLLSPPAAPLSKLGLDRTPSSSPKLYVYHLSGLKASFGMWSLRCYWSKGRRSQDQKLCQQPRQGVARAGFPRTTLCLVALTIFFPPLLDFYLF